MFHIYVFLKRAVMERACHCTGPATCHTPHAPSHPLAGEDDIQRSKRKTAYMWPNRERIKQKFE